MERPKLSDKEVEELLRVIEEDGLLLDTVMNEAEKFVYDLGIKSGNEKIGFVFIWDTYKRWAGKKRIGHRTFKIQFAKLFPRYNTGLMRYYKLNREPFEESLGRYFEIRRKFRDRKIKRRAEKEKRNQKKQD